MRGKSTSQQVPLRVSHTRTYVCLLCWQGRIYHCVIRRNLHPEEESAKTSTSASKICTLKCLPQHPEGLPPNLCWLESLHILQCIQILRCLQLPRPLQMPSHVFKYCDVFNCRGPFTALHPTDGHHTRCSSLLRRTLTGAGTLTPPCDGGWGWVGTTGVTMSKSAGWLVFSLSVEV